MGSLRSQRPAGCGIVVVVNRLHSPKLTAILQTSRPPPPLYAYSIAHRYTKGEMVSSPAEPLFGEIASRAGHNWGEGRDLSRHLLQLHRPRASLEARAHLDANSSCAAGGKLRSKSTGRASHHVQKCVCSLLERAALRAECGAALHIACRVCHVQCGCGSRTTWEWVWAAGGHRAGSWQTSVGVGIVQRRCAA